MSQHKFVSALLIGLVILLSIPFGSHPLLIPKVRAVTTNITLYAYFLGWNNSKSSGANPTITVTQGDTISFTLIEGDSSTHRLLLDIDNSSITTDCPNSGPDKCSGNITPTAGSSIPSFTVTSAPGTYFYYCTYHSPAYMVGKFIVLSQDYAVASSPSSITINQGSSGTSTITITGVNGFSGTVNLAASASTGGATVSMNPQSITLSTTITSAISTLTVSLALGQFSVTVTATSGAASHSTLVAVSGPDFSLSTSSMSLSVSQGSSARINVTLASVNAFSGSVGLSATTSSGGPPVMVSPASVQVSSGGASTATVTVTASNSGVYSMPVSPGSYNITLTGTMSSLSHSKVIPLTVTSPASGAGILSNPIVIPAIAASIVILGIAVYILRRRLKK